VSPATATDVVAGLDANDSINIQFTSSTTGLASASTRRPFAENDIGFDILPRLSDDNEPLARSNRRIAAVDEEIGARHERGLVAG